jgi:hypothetical protein
MNHTQELAERVAGEARPLGALEEAGLLGEFAARVDLDAARAERDEDWMTLAGLLERAERYRGLQLWALTRAGVEGVVGMVEEGLLRDC